MGSLCPKMHVTTTPVAWHVQTHSIARDTTGTQRAACINTAQAWRDPGLVYDPFAIVCIVRGQSIGFYAQVVDMGTHAAKQVQHMHRSASEMSCCIALYGACAVMFALLLHL